MEQSYKFRIYPNNEQWILMKKTFGCHYVYNHFLAERIETYKNETKSVSRFEQDKKLTLVKQGMEWLWEVGSTALQAALQNLDSAYQNFFCRVKNNEKPGFPRFKRKHDNRKSYKSKVVGKNIEIFEKEIKLPKLRKAECRVSKKVSGRILSATVSQNPSGKYSVSVCCTDVDIPQYPSTSKSIGLDMGLKTFAVSSEGIHFENHKYCGAKHSAMKDLSVRKWVCPVCGAEHERDENAARNILVERQRIVSANRVCDVLSEENNTVGHMGIAAEMSSARLLVPTFADAWGVHVRPSQDGNEHRTKNLSSLAWGVVK
ncbi:MAG: transposase [Treponema sp.]|jgi:putative transposase|nr:transposase [Treponema sp.]